MTQEKGFTALVVLLSLGIFYFHPDFASSLLFLCSSLSFGIVIFLEHRALKTKDDVQKQIKELSNKIEALYLGKGFGR